MSPSTPESPPLCHLPPIKAQLYEQVEKTVETLRSLPAECKEHNRDSSIGQDRKRAIAVLIVLTNLVPVCLPSLLSGQLLIFWKMISFGLGIGGGLIIGESLGVNGPSDAAWIPASYS